MNNMCGFTKSEMEPKLMLTLKQSNKTRKGHQEDERTKMVASDVLSQY